MDSGLSDVLANLAGLIPEVEHQAARAVLAEGHDLKDESDDLCPKRSGGLVRSGYVEQDGLTVTVGYRKSYAVEVHEDLTIHHANGQAKFLERPLVAREGSFADRIAGRMKL